MDPEQQRYMDCLGTVETCSKVQCVNEKNALENAMKIQSERIDKYEGDAKMKQMMIQDQAVVENIKTHSLCRNKMPITNTCMCTTKEEQIRLRM